jgi:hypothetical protein
MDLKDLAPSADTLEVILHHPGTGEPLLNEGRDEEMSITVWLPHTKAYKKAMYELTDLNLQMAQKDPESVRKAEYLTSRGIELLAKTVKAWDITLEGKCPKVSLAKAKEVFETYPWIRSQVESAVEANSNFT